MRLTQGTFSFLPDLTDDRIAAQLAYAVAQGWALSIEHARAPHPRDTYWEMWGLPMFDLRDPAAVLAQIRACRAANPDAYVKVNAFDSTRGWETVRLSFLVARPAEEPGFELSRREGPGRSVRYEIRRRGREA
jgi:ribulose-bisphosphate carboxylase small chain